MLPSEKLRVRGIAFPFWGSRLEAAEERGGFNEEDRRFAASSPPSEWVYVEAAEEDGRFALAVERDRMGEAGEVLAEIWAKRGEDPAGREAPAGGRREIPGGVGSVERHAVGGGADQNSRGVNWAVVLLAGLVLGQCWLIWVLAGWLVG